MKVKSISRFFSMKKVTLSFVTLFIGVGTIGSYNQFADASTKTQQTHVTKTSPTQRRRPILNVQLKIRLLNLELHQQKSYINQRAISPKNHQLKTTIAKIYHSK